MYSPLHDHGTVSFCPDPDPHRASEVVNAEEDVPFQSLEFNIPTQDEILRSSAAEINDPNFDAPIGGLYDERMGVLESFRRCKTCQQTRLDCPGHPGHIVLQEPVFHPLLWRPLLHFVRCICLECRQALVTSESLRLLGFQPSTAALSDPVQRVEEIAALLTKKLVGGMCTRLHPATGAPCMTLISKFTFTNDQLMVSVAYQEPGQAEVEPEPEAEAEPEPEPEAEVEPELDADPDPDPDPDADGVDQETLPVSVYVAGADADDHASDPESDDEPKISATRAPDKAKLKAKLKAKGKGKAKGQGRAKKVKAKAKPKPRSVGVQYRAPRAVAASRLREILVHVPEAEYMDLMGLRAPNPALWPIHYIVTFLPVLPPSARPWVLMYGGMKADDDLTYKYADIIRYSNALANPRLTVTERAATVQMLTFQVKTLVDNTKNLSQHPNRRPLFCIKRRLGGKEGRVRKNLSGKRSIWTARTVIGPDPNLGVDELAIPPAFAQKLTFPERVTPANRDWLLGLIAAGRANYVIQGGVPPDPLNPGGGAMSRAAGAEPPAEARRNLSVFYGVRDREDFEPGDLVFQIGTGTWRAVQPFRHRLAKGRPLALRAGDWVWRRRATDAPVQAVAERVLLHLSRRRPDDAVAARLTAVPPPASARPFPLRVGDIVERHLRDGDLVLFNRQPTLHRGSMQALRVRVVPGLTMRFSLALTNAFNADFDGDEMNIFVPQSQQVRVWHRIVI